MAAAGSCWRSAVLGLLTLVLLGAVTTPGRAMEVTCVEASRYKYLYLLFGNDKRRFAQFLGLELGALPPPEACRAVLIAGRIEPATRETAATNDFQTLLTALMESRGGLATLYLASGGGNVQMGLRLGQATRMFWLKTHAVDGASFDYVPDFLGADGPGAPARTLPAGLDAGWRAYRDATAKFVTVRVAEAGKKRRCASACTFLHVAGIHRYGPAYFHRARRSAPRTSGGGGGKPPAQPSMSELLERLHRVEAWIIAHYRYMDAGERAIELYQSTATQTTRGAMVPASPRYIADHLAGVCPARARPRRSGASPTRTRFAAVADAVVAQDAASQTPLQKEPLPRFPQQPAPGLQPGGPAPPAPQSADPEVIRCVASAHERERYAQYAKLCAGSCDRAALFREATERARALMPPDPTPRRPAPPR